MSSKKMAAFCTAVRGWCFNVLTFYFIQGGPTGERILKNGPHLQKKNTVSQNVRFLNHQVICKKILSPGDL